MSFEIMASSGDYFSHRCSLPGVRSISSGATSPSEMGDDRKLPPLPRIEPLPRGGPFNLASNIFTPTPSPSSTQETFPLKSTWPVSEHITTPPSPANSSDGSWPEPAVQHKAFEWPQDLSPTDLLHLIAPKTINRKPPLQQLCGRKRKGSMISGEADDQREKHRIAEGNRRKNLSQLHRDLDGRIHDFFLERAGWNPAKSLPESKEHIVQGAIFLIDFMLAIIVHLIRQENELPRQLSEQLQPQFRCMQLQQLIGNLQQQNLTAQQQIETMKEENRLLQERNEALEFKLKAYEQMFPSPKSEQPTRQQTLTQIPETKPRNTLPGLHVMCNEIAAVPSEYTRMDRMDSLHSNSSFTFGRPCLNNTPPTTGPSSPVFTQPSYSVASSRRPSMIPSP